MAAKLLTAGGCSVGFLDAGEDAHFSEWESLIYVLLNHTGITRADRRTRSKHNLIIHVM